MKIKSSPVERLDSAEEFLVVPAVDEHLSVILYTVRQHPEWSCVELLLLPSLHLLWGHFNLTHLQALGIVRLKQELIHTLNRFSVMYSTSFIII